MSPINVAAAEFQRQITEMRKSLERVNSGDFGDRGAWAADLNRRIAELELGIGRPSGKRSR